MLAGQRSMRAPESSRVSRAAICWRRDACFIACHSVVDGMKARG
jgi:hypothetical protein